MAIDSYMRALDEIRSNRLERGAWTQALQACEGDVARARDEYVLRRVDDLEPPPGSVRPLCVLMLREVACVVIALGLLTGAYLAAAAMIGSLTL
jgi:hypothetical protein